MDDDYNMVPLTVFKQWIASSWSLYIRPHWR